MRPRHCPLGLHQGSPDPEGGRLTVELRHSPGLAATKPGEDSITAGTRRLFRRKNGPRLGPSCELGC